MDGQSEGDFALLTIFAALYGLGSGGYVAMIAPILAEYFGTEKIGSVLGCFMPSVALGGFFGPWLAGHAFDLWGSYDLPFWFRPPADLSPSYWSWRCRPGLIQAMPSSDGSD